MKRRNNIIVMFFMVMLLLVSCGPSLSEDEQYMLKCAKQIPEEYGISKDYTITDNPWVIKTDSETYAVIPLSGQTDSGAPRFGIAIFVDGSYFMDGMENVPTDSGSTDDLEKLIVLRNINASDAYGFEKIEIDKDKIMEEMK